MTKSRFKQSEIVKTRLWVGLLALVGLGLTGCEHLSSVGSRNPSTAVLTSPKATVQHPVLAQTPKAVFAETTVGALRINKTLPPEVAAGDEFSGEVSITALSPVTNVVVRDTIPGGATYLRSEPAAVIEGGELVWKPGALRAAQGVKLKAWFRAEQAGAPIGPATVTAGPRLSASVHVGKPVLALDKTGPETTVLGANVNYTMLVRNIGSVVARSVVVREALPAGLSHSSGKSEVLLTVGDLPPGQAKSMTVLLKASQRGTACGTATVSSSNAPPVSREICTTVLVPGLKVENSGPKEQILGRNADYEILITNPGDTTLTNVLISSIAPEECSLVAAPGALLTGNQATWSIATLPPGAKVTETVKLTAKRAGASCHTVTASVGASAGASVGAVSDSARACTLWKGIPAVTFELSDQPDPIQIGESTTYTVKVINQGSGDIHNVKITAVFDNLLLPISSPQGAVSGQRVIFPVVAMIGARQSVTYTIMVKGTAVGDARSRVELSCDEVKTPVGREESTMIY